MSQIKIGLKLWTTNGDWFDAAAQAFKDNSFDFIEIAIRSDVENTLGKIAHIPLSFHIAFDDKSHIIFMPAQLFENTADMRVEDLPNNLCLDLSKAITASARNKMDYRDYLKKAMEKKPFYFHLSSARNGSEDSEHLNLWDGDIDWLFIKKKLLPENAYLVFETPKDETGVENDLRNMEHFRQL